MLKFWRILKTYLPLILEILKDFDLKALQAADDKKEEFKKQVKGFLDLE